MDRHNENLMDSILVSMAATTLSKRLNNTIENIDNNEMTQNIKDFDNNVLKKAMRKNDCYTQVSKSIGDNMDDDLFFNGSIRVYSLAGKIAHCILVDENKNIITDAFENNRTKYDIKNGNIEYNTAKDFDNIPMTKNYELGDESFEISVKDYLKVVEKVQPLIELGKNRPDSEKGKLINMLNQGFHIDDALDMTLSSSVISQDINQKRDYNHKNKI